MNIFKIIGYKKILAFIVLALIITLVEYLTIFTSQLNCYEQKISLNFACTDIGGQWLGEYKECAYASESWCSQQGGVFKECESACRHDKNADICTMQCVPVCVFNLDNSMFAYSPEDNTYVIDGEVIVLRNGKSNQEIVPGSASRKITKIWGTVEKGDLNDDGANDAAMILTQETGGSGTFFYVVASLYDKLSKKYNGTNSILMGDRIAPQNIQIENKTIIVNYADRAKDEPMIAKPSVGVTLRAEIDSQNNLIKLQDRYSYNDKIYVNSPQPGEKIKSPLIIKGAARGNWFFEASFPVFLTNWDGLIIAEGVATAQGDWMTEDYVGFKAELKFTKPELYSRGALILKKDNPSGLSANDDAFEIGINFE